MALAEAGTPCVVINRRILDVHGAANADHIGLLRRLRPAAVAEKKWKSDLKHGRIIVIVDGLNEIRLRYGRETLWKAVEQIVIGNHPCPVMATTRALGDMDDWVALRSIELMELRPFADEEVDAFLSDAGLDVGAARSAIEDAGLTEPATNPLVLSHIVDLLLSPGDVGTKLPRSRAGVLMRTFEHVAEKRGLIDLKRGQAPVELAPAIAAAAALCVIFDPQSAETGRDLRFNLAELHSLLALSWPDAVQPDWTNLLTDMHLARMVTAAAGNEAEFAHQTLIDLAVALLFRGRELPDFLILDRPDLAQTIGDWVGLHADPELAVNQAIDFAQRHYRPDLLVDVAAANDGILTPAQREMLWAAIGVGLAGSRRMRDRTADRLAELSTSLARSAIGFGLFSTISKDEDLTAETRTLLLSRRLNARSFKRALQLSTWRRRRSRKDKMTHSSGRFGTLDRDALVDILQRATLQQKRGAAAKALGVLGDRSAVSALCAALQDEAPSVRGSAATALGALGDSSAVSVLCTALQ
ncbi:HEAT repeat domain-containing protein, partial [Bradyrhizobium oligotrophicum]